MTLLELGRRGEALPLLLSSAIDLAADLPPSDDRVVAAKRRLAEIEGR